MYRLFFKIVFIVASLCYNTAQAQVNLPIYMVVSDQYLKTKGFAITTQGDTLKGYFNLKDRKGVVFCKKQNVPREDTIVDKEKLRMIFLEIQSKEFYGTNGLTEYQYFPRFKNIFRKIYSGRLEYFDENTITDNPDKIFGNIVIVDIRHDVVCLLSDNNGRRPFKLLVNYLNATSRSLYKYKDFKSSIEVIREIEKLPD